MSPSPLAGTFVKLGELLGQKNDVTLVWPYKDCVLEGGQTREDRGQEEVFYNETLAPEEVRRLLYPKAFKNAKRYAAEGEEPITEFDSSDNLIIKGNNLLALSSLLERYEGQVKCIYIDPPYYFESTKPSDAFKYNSNFKLSTWLTFMKNRFELAYLLLKNQGVIFCHISEDGMHWIKILMEEVFGRNNFVETFIWKNTDNADSLSPKSRSSVEYLICFEKKKDSSLHYVGKNSENGDAPLLNTGNSYHNLTFPAGSIKFNLPDGIYTGKPDRVEIIGECEVKNGINTDEVTLAGEFKWGQQMLDEELRKGTYFLIKSSKFSIRFQRVEASSMAPEKYIDEQYLSKAIGVGSNEDATSHLSSIGLEFKYSKPESIVAFLLRATTQKDDLVMDFFLGSGTTAAVAHKMGRRYIGVEQMDYIEGVAVERLKKVIAGEQGGISKSQNWQGGGSFVYVELAERNEVIMSALQEANTSDEVLALLDQVTEGGMLKPAVLPDDLRKHREEIASLELDEQKHLVAELVDKNKLYVNSCDVDDAENGLSDADRVFTKSFYNVQED